MSNVAQNIVRRPRGTSRHHRELAEALGAGVRDPLTANEDAPLASVLLAGLGNGLCETTPGMSLFSEAISTFRALLALQQIGGYSEQDENDLEVALQAVRLRLETAFTLIHLESTLDDDRDVRADVESEDAPVSHAAEE